MMLEALGKFGSKVNKFLFTDGGNHHNFFKLIQKVSDLKDFLKPSAPCKELTQLMGGFRAALGPSFLWNQSVALYSSIVDFGISAYTNKDYGKTKDKSLYRFCGEIIQEGCEVAQGLYLNRLTFAPVVGWSINGTALKLERASVAGDVVECLLEVTKPSKPSKPSRNRQADWQREGVRRDAHYRNVFRIAAPALSAVANGFNAFASSPVMPLPVRVAEIAGTALKLLNAWMRW